MTDVVDGVSYERLERPDCPLCGGTYPARLLAVQFNMAAMVAECRNCRLAYQTPRPSLQASLAYMNMRWCSQDAYVADAEAQRSKVRAQLELLAPIVPSRPRVLDFGAGIGTFVSAAREQGWDAVGVERSRSALERAARNALDLVPDPTGLRGQFDVITMWDVVEHLRDPQDTIESLRPRLRPGGWMIFETANWESWVRLAAGDAWGFYLFDHQYYFSPASLESLVSRAGLVDFRLLPVAHIAPPADPARDDDAAANATREAYRRGMELWPEHAGINLLVGAARAR